MKSLRRFAVIVPLVLVAEMSLLGAHEAFAQKLRVAYTAFAGTFTILWVGHDAGLYRKAGVDLELLYIGSSTKAVQALLGGDIDIVYSAAGAVVDANAAGADLVMIGCQYDQGQTSFFTTASHHQHQRAQRQGGWRDPIWLILGFRCAPRTEEKSAPAGERCCIAATGRDLGNHRRDAKEPGAGRIDFASAIFPSSTARIQTSC